MRLFSLPALEREFAQAGFLVAARRRGALPRARHRLAEPWSVPLVARA